MSDQGPQAWPGLIAWILVRAPIVVFGAALAGAVILYFGFIVVSLVGGTSAGQALAPGNFFGRDCIEISEQGGRVFQIDQCAKTVVEIPASQ